MELLHNRTKPLNLGYHGVCCRSQKNLNDAMTLEASLVKEAHFFQTNQVFKTATKSLVGTSQLTKKLAELLQETIVKSLPSVI